MARRLAEGGEDALGEEDDLLDFFDEQAMRRVDSEYEQLTRRTAVMEEASEEDRVLAMEDAALDGAQRVVRRLRSFASTVFDAGPANTRALHSIVDVEDGEEDWYAQFDLEDRLASMRFYDELSMSPDARRLSEFEIAMELRQAYAEADEERAAHIAMREGDIYRDNHCSAAEMELAKELRAVLEQASEASEAERHRRLPPVMLGLMPVMEGRYDDWIV